MPVSALLGRFSESLTELVNRAFGGKWADNSEFIILSELTRGGSPTTKELAARASLARYALSHLIERLRGDGFVTTSAGQTDGRQVVVHLTSRGRERAEALNTAIEALFSASGDLVAAVLSSLERPEEPSRSEQPLGDGMAMLGLIGRVGLNMVGDTRGVDVPRVNGRQRAALVQIAGSGDVRPVDIGQAQSTSRQNAAYVINQLARAGLLERRHGQVPGDARAVTLMITDRGRDVVAGVDAAVWNHREELFDLFSQIAHWSHGPLLKGSPAGDLWRHVAGRLGPLGHSTDPHLMSTTTTGEGHDRPPTALPGPRDA